MNRMTRALRRINRQLGFDVTRWPQPSETMERLVWFLSDRRVDLVLDVGANVGQFGRDLRQYGYAGRILSFEPGVEAHEHLSAAAADDLNWTVAERVALGDRDGQVELHSFSRSDMNSILPPTSAFDAAFGRIQPNGTILVPMRRLDRYLVESREAATRMFLKLDTQGAELSVIAGSADVLERVVGIQAELPVKPIYDGMPPLHECLQQIGALGFVPLMTSPASFNERLGAQIDLDIVFSR